MIARSEAIKQLRRLKADIINGLSFISKTKDKHPALDSLDMAIASLETDEAYQFEYESTSKNDCETCIHNKGVLECDMYGCKYEPTTKNDLGVDAVSRQAVLVAMRNNHRDGGRDIDGDYIEGNYSEKLYDAITSLPTVTPPQEQRWIPVSERLPEDSGEYLVSVIDEEDKSSWYKQIEVAWFAHKKDYDIKESEWRELGIDETVIAWMPLPKTYGEVEECQEKKQ